MLVAVALGAVLAPLNSTMIAVALPRIIDAFHTTSARPGGSSPRTCSRSRSCSRSRASSAIGTAADVLLGGRRVRAGIARRGAGAEPRRPDRLPRAAGGLGAVVFPNGAGLIREVVRPTAAAARSGSSAARSRSPRGSAACSAACPCSPVAGARSSTSTSRSSRPRSCSPGDSSRCTPGATVHDTLFDWLGAGAARVGRRRSAAGLVLEGGHAHAILPVPGVPCSCSISRSCSSSASCALRIPCSSRAPSRPCRSPLPTRASGSSNLAFYTVLLATPILLTRHLDWSSLQVGLALALLSAPMVVFAPIGGRLADRYGRRLPSVAGCVVLTIGAPAARARRRAAPVRSAALPRADGRRRRALDRRPAGVRDRGARSVAGGRRGRAVLDLALHRQLRRLDRPRAAARPRTTGWPASTPCS